MSFSVSKLRQFTNSGKFKTLDKENLLAIEFWKKLYWRRKDLWITQTKLSKKTWITQRIISMLENWTYENKVSIDLIERLAGSLEIDIEYFLEDFLDRKTFEMYNYIFSKLRDIPDRMQFMKIPYFIDIEYYKEFKKLLTNFHYIRYYYWPFDKKLYNYQRVFAGNEKGFVKVQYTYLNKDDISLIDKVLSEIPINNWTKLKKLSYETAPMQKLWATLWWDEWIFKSLDFSTLKW